MDRRSIFVTGAASGIGREAARLFSKKGWFVGCADINQSGLKALEVEIGADNGLFQTLDVADRTSFLSVIQACSSATHGRMDIMFSNAGIDAKGPFDSMSWDTILAVININLLGVLSGIHAAIPLLKATPNSLCMATASASAIFGAADMAVYSATKHAIRGLIEALSMELMPHGVRAADVLPGIIDTGILADEDRARVPTEGMWRLITPAQVAEAVWAAYYDEKLHWYVPDELKAFDLAATECPEKVRASLMKMRG